MIYPNNYEDKIGFTQIRRLIKDNCLSPLGASRVESMKFSNKYDTVKHQIDSVSEFVAILGQEEFPDENFFDVRESLHRLHIENTWLDPDGLFELQRSLDAIIKIVNFFDTQRALLYPTLASLASDVPVFPHIVKRIGCILDKYGNIKDNASPYLLEIRQSITNTSNSISRLLQTILRQAKSEGLVEKDASPAMRDGRLVIPVAPSMKRKLNGIVHDESDTGRTVYIEPAEVVEANNKIRELEAEERREIIRILLEFADSIREDIPQIALSYEFLADIDFIRAKARFAIDTDSKQPVLEKKPVLDWGMAVHPLLRRSLAKTGRKVIPLDILLNTKQRILLISGPNAGGKSVCLKTVGLLQYMLQCGMLVPLAESSVCGIFDNLFIDIGDEQSLEDDLSTYSSHLLNMKNMMKSANHRTLILIDEFGGGTEPQIGGAIAEAVLKRFNEKKAFGVITTHYQNLKHYAKDTPGIVNGAMLYDRQMMQPLFQLRIGNPGSSFAVEIARKIGIPEDVISDASAIVGQDYINADKYLQDIVRDKRYWESKRQSIHQQEKKLESTIAEYQEKMEGIKGKKREILDQAKQDAENLLRKSNALIEQTVKEIKEAQAEKEETKKIREKLNRFKKEINSTLEPQKPQNHSEASIPAQFNCAKTAKPQNLKTIELTVGSYVRLKGQTLPGKITKINDKEAQVEFGSIITNVELSRLEGAEMPKKQSSASTAISPTSILRSTHIANFKGVVDVRGMRGDECLEHITHFIDDALVANVKSVSILHGTGNGILRNLVRQYLQTVPEIASFRDELPQFGGTGITVVEFS